MAEFEKQVTKARLLTLYERTLRKDVIVIIKKGRIIIKKDNKNMSKRYRLTKQNFWRIIKVLVYSGLSAMAVSAIALLKEVNVPDQWIWIVPIANTLLYTIKEFFTVQQ